MKRITREFKNVVVGVIVIIIALGFAGSIEYREQVIYNMSQPKYEAIVKKLGSTSEKEIVREYIDNKEYYDTHY